PCEERQRRRRVGGIAEHLVNGALLRVDEGGQFRQHQLTDRDEVALPLQHARELGQIRLQPVLLLVSVGRLTQVVDHRIDVVFQLGNFTSRLHLNRPGQVTFGHRRGDLRDGADLIGQIRREEVDVTRQVLPRTRCSRYVGLTAEAALDADLAGDVGHLFGKRRERVGHVVDGLGKRGNLAFRFDRELLTKAAVGDRRDDLHDAADLVRQVRSHDVDRVREVLPRTADSWYLGLAAQLPFGTDLACDTSDFRRKGAELIDHGVDRVLQLENLALDVDGDLPREVAAGDGGGDFRDVANLRSE